ncbi:hypothetical protein [Kordiimonas aquimaris]|uniref:hypothetical protein n=1 Tax=Kordiimonas aquimaris TaxID=707591 RepID=UPI0021D22338|nr:hypothetical protein [Kordiimonas aquimaris]
MTLKRFTLLSILAAAFALSGVAGIMHEDTAVHAQQDEADDTDKADTPERKKTRAERRRDRIMSRYEATGKVENCVPMRSLRQSHIFDDQTIFFESIGKRGYRNRMPNKCAGLLREERFAYANSFGSLCRAQIITVLDNFGRTWGSCSLGDFEEYTKKPKTDAE